MEDVEFPTVKPFIKCQKAEKEVDLQWKIILLKASNQSVSNYIPLHALYYVPPSDSTAIYITKLTEILGQTHILVMTDIQSPCNLEACI